MGLFDKKYCDVCGEKIGLLGNKKTADGNLCKACNAKLSPWFFNRKKSTTEEIKAQLKYREENQAKAEAFHKDRIFGTGMKVFVDKTAAAFAVTRSEDFKAANPDIIPISAVQSVDCQIRETKREVKTKDKDGKSVSYNPPRYDYYYTFSETIRVDSPYFSVIRFDLNSSALKLETTGSAVLTIGRILGNGKPDPNASPEYRKYVEMSRELKAALLPDTVITEEEPAITEVEDTPAGAPVTCPWCGSKVTPDEEGLCPECTGPLNS